MTTTAPTAIVTGASRGLGFALARSLAEGPSIAFRYIKDNLDEALELAYPAAIDREAERMLRAQGTQDHKEAVRAFVEKRKPIFQGK